MRFGARALTGGLGACALALAVSVAPAAPASAAGSVNWASAGKATIRPGVTVTMAGVTCAAGFLFTDGTHVYVSIPTSCAGVSDGQPTDGCTAAQVPYGTTAKITGARYKGHFVYSSDTEMQLRGTKSEVRCNNNSLALIRLDRRDIKRANPSALGTGGPTGVATTAPAQGASLTVALDGVGTAATAFQNPNPWAHQIMVSAPVDKTTLGSPVMTATGKAVGLLTLVQQIETGPSTVSDLYREIKFLNTVHGFGDVHLAKGTAKFHAA